MSSQKVLTRSAAAIDRHSSKGHHIQNHGHKIFIMGKYSGLMSMGLPYPLDAWYNYLGKKGISIHMHMLTGDDIHNIMSVRTSTNQHFLILTNPMTSNLV
eukprot:5039326-Ditylum_brightwellii.AAC.1